MAADSQPDNFNRLVDEKLSRLDTTYSAKSVDRVPLTAYHRAAAVLSAFDMSLRPAGTPAHGESIDHVLVDAEPILRSGELHFHLLPDVRRRTLEALRTPDAMRQARTANQQAPLDVVQQMFDRYLDGKAPALNQQSLAELTATFEIAPWLAGLVPGVPPPQAVRARIEFETLLSPFEDLVGTHFGGRKPDLQKLRDYVGVLEPSSFAEGVWRSVRDVFSLHDKPPLVIYGPGGYGKSTLLGRFILEHARLDDDRRFPFVYVDFDRATIAADEPLTILVEAVRQLGIQYLHAQSRGDALRDGWRRRMGRQRGSSSARRSADKKRPRVERTSFIDDFKSFLSSLELDQRPLLLVLDTFEEVQRRGTAYVSELWQFLGELQRRHPRLRAVLSGRAPVTGVGFDGEPLATELHKLDRLDLDASAAILEKQGLPPDTARRIASRVGGSPLTLRLAAQLVKKRVAAHENAVGEFDEDALERAVADGEIERYLYTRILEHIGDARVRALAHPGLVLRRVTSDLILEVLAVPCQLTITSKQEADTLFDELRREVSLVVPTDEPNALRHRPDLRQLMLRFMERTDPDRVRIIHQGAAEFYRRRKSDSPIDCAEEIYHRLALGEYGPALDARWLPGVETWLFSALEELPPVPRAWLAARLHVELPPEERSQAPLEVWEGDAARRARELLALGQAQSALSVLAERTDRSGTSPLFLIEAEILSELLRPTDALAVLDRGVRGAFETGSDALRADLQIAAAQLELLMNRPVDAHQRVDDVEPIALRRNDAMQLIGIGLTRIVAFRILADAPESGDDVAAIRSRLIEWLAGASDQQLASNPALTRRLGAEIGARDVGALTRIVRLAGIGNPKRDRLRPLGDALEAWDRDLAETPQPDAKSSGTTPLTRLVNFGDASERTWQSFVLTAPIADVDAACRRILQEFTPPAHVAAVLASLLGPGGPTSAPDARLETSSGDSIVSMTGAQMQRAVEAIVDAYPVRSALENFVEYRFDRNLSSIATATDLHSTALQLLQGAHAQGWDDELLLGLCEVNPRNPALRQLVEELGLVSPTAGVLDRLARGSGQDRQALALRLIALQAQVCRIEPGDAAAIATGFLVAPDIVVTVASALMDVIKESSPVDGVQVRFDYIRRDDQTGETGTAHRLHRPRWLVDWTDPTSGLDLACIRLAAPIGRQAIGGARTVPGAPARGWIALGGATTVETGKPIVLIHHPVGEALQVTLQERGIERVIAEGRELRYSARISPGAAGAPIFDARLQLIGMHNGSVGGWRNLGVKRGASIAAIVDRLRSRGLESVFAPDAKA